ncbi:MAG: hypothetical protein AAF911_08075 [Planctomycetota bacterium]
MSAHPPKELNDMDKAVLGDKAWPLRRNLLVLGIVMLLLALASSALPQTFFFGGWDRLGFAYLIGYAFALAITLGSLFFVLVTTVFRAGWCVAFRRVPENIAANMPIMGILALPILALVLQNDGSLYPWAGGKDSHTNLTIYETGKKIASHNEDLIKKAAGYDEAEAEPEDDSHSAAPASDQAFEIITVASPGEAEGKDTHASEGHHDAAKHDGHHAEGDHHEAHHAWTYTAEHWKDHNHGVPYYVYKRGLWYTPFFFIIRWIFYIAVWSFLGWFYWKRSVTQDSDGDVQHTHKREWWAPLSLVAFAVTITLASFDLLMSLDPAWYSTMFGVYFFAGCFTAAICTMIITLMLGQKAGYFQAVTTEHFHDLGKLLFAFVFFWGYVGFSQFMLIWYASFPETTYWWEIRGITSVSGDALQDAPPTFAGGWTFLAWTLLFAHLLLPFAILLSKHVKRNRTALFTMACWMLTLCYIDIYWVTMPAFASPDFIFGLPEIGCVVGCVAIMLAEALRRASRVSLTAHRDPRMHESLALDTTAWAPLYFKH